MAAIATTPMTIASAQKNSSGPANMKISTSTHPPMIFEPPTTTQPKYSSSYRPRPRKPEISTTPMINGNPPKDTPPVEKKRKPTEAALRCAQDMLKLMADMPAPFEEELPPNYLQSPYPSPPSPIHASFLEYALAPEYGGYKRPADDLIGLGLILDPSIKRYKPTYEHYEFSGVLTKMGTHKPTGLSKAGWSPANWHDLHKSTAQRAILSKRYADAYGRTPQAKQDFNDKVSQNHTLSLLRFTDSVLLFLYSYWCHELATRRPHPDQYSFSDQLRDTVRQMWEREYRQNDISSEEKERIGCMVGLMHMIEAMVANHLSHAQATAVQQKNLDISRASQASSQSGAAVPPVPSLVGRSPHSISPPDERSPSNISSDSAAMEVVNLANELANNANSAAEHLHNSRRLLSPVLMRNYFPRMFANTMMSDFSSEALPAPGDMLGSGRSISLDNTDHFAWPIELGMSAGIAHLVAFGRGMVKEYSERSGFEWELHLS